MSESFDIDGVDRITAGSVGDPGQRSFYVQAQAGVQTVIRNLIADFDLTMGLAGCASVAEIGPSSLAGLP